MPATVADVVSRWGRDPSEGEARLIATRLEDVLRLIRRRIPGVDAKAETDAGYAADVVMVQCEAVLRLVRNPDGYTSETDGSYTYQLSGEVATGRLEILPAEWDMLGAKPRGMFALVPSMGLAR